MHGTCTKLFRATGLFAVSIIPPMLHNHSFIYTDVNLGTI